MADGNGRGWHAVRATRAGAEDRALTDRHAVENLTPAPNPDAVADIDTPDGRAR